MEWGNTLLDDYVLSLTGRAAAAGLLPADRQRRRRPLRGAVLPGVLRVALRAVAHLAVPARDGRRRPARAPARPGPDLRRRRQPGVAAGHVAGARDRRWRCASLAGGRGAVRRLGRLAVLVLDALSRLPRGPPRAARGARLPAVRATPCTTTRSAGAATAFLRRGRRRHAGRATASATARRCTSSAPSWPRSCPRARGARPRYVTPTARRRARRERMLDGRAIRERRRAEASAPRWLRDPRRSPGAGSSRWAAAGSRWSERIAALDRFVLELTGKPVPRICFLPTASGDPREQVDPLPRALRRLAVRAVDPVAVSPRRATGSTRSSICSPRTRSTSAAARCATCSPIWREHAVDEAMRAAWERGIVLAGLSAGAMCWFEGGVTMSGGSRRAPTGSACSPAACRCTWTASPSGCRSSATRSPPGGCRRVRRRRRRRAAVRAEPSSSGAWPRAAAPAVSVAGRRRGRRRSSTSCR